MSRPRLNAAWLASAAGRTPASAPDGHSPAAASPALPAYDREARGVGIVHLGAGHFHKAHQAVYTDDVLARHGGDWRILGVSLRNTEAADALNPQDGLYTVLVRDECGTRARVVGSLAGVVAAARDPEKARMALVDPRIRLVTLTVTEKAYGVDRASGRIQPGHAAVSHDLAHPDQPGGVLGLLVWALRRRRADGVPPFTVLCCDNLPENGRLVRAGVRDLAERIEPGLGDWIARHVAFPCSMVDRITPASTARTMDDAARATGCEDRAAVETEPFTMWVIEDHFPEGRPAWEAAGALMVRDVAPYEHMKLRMLNGAHSLLAYAGHVAGHVYVRDAMRDAALSRCVDRYLQEAAATLRPLAGVDFGDYAGQLRRRFANPAIAHETYQIAMDGTEKLPQRILGAAGDALAAGRDPRAFAFATAAWMRYCLGMTDAGHTYALRDPRAEDIAAAVHAAVGSGAASAADPDSRPRLPGGRHAAALRDVLMGLPGLFPKTLCESALWRGQVEHDLRIMLDRGMSAALAASS